MNSHGAKFGCHITNKNRTELEGGGGIRSPGIECFKARRSGKVVALQFGNALSTISLSIERALKIPYLQIPFKLFSSHCIILSYFVLLMSFSTCL